MNARAQLHFMQSGSFDEGIVLSTMKMGLPTSINITR